MYLVYQLEAWFCAWNYLNSFPVSMLEKTDFSIDYRYIGIGMYL